jgi:uncharacterized protein YcbK (DUF882 family)
MTKGNFYEIVEAGRARYGGSIISGGRSMERNRNVDGHPDSFHLMGLAFDIVFDTVEGLKACARYYKRSGLHTKLNGRLTLHVQVYPPAPDLT